MTGYPWQTGDELLAADLNAAVGMSFGGQGAAFVTPTPPISPMAGFLWFDPVSTQLYVWYVDDNSSQWVIANNTASLSPPPSGGPFLPIGGGTMLGPLTAPVINAEHLNLGGATGNGLGVTLSGIPTYTTSPLWVNTYFTGSNANINNQSFNTLIVNDNVAYTGNGQSNALLIRQNTQANATKAGGLWVESQQTAAPINPFGFCTALTAASSLSYNCGGSALTVAGVKGVATTLNTYTAANSGATFAAGIVGYELDIHARSGSSIGGKTGLLIVRLADDAVSGAFGADSAIAFGGSSPTAGWDYVLNIGGGAGQIPYKSTATFIGASEPQTPSTGQALAAWGIDFSGVLFSGGFARSLGFLVDGSGNLISQRHSISNWSLTPSSTGLAIDAVAQRASLTSIAAGGAGWIIGDKATTANGGVYQITAVSGAVATAVVQLVPDVAVSPPANPVATTATNTSIFHPNAGGLTLNLTWTAANGLSLNPTGQRVGFNGTAPIVKPTVTGAKGSNAALASLLSALAAYGLITDSTSA